MLPLAYILRNIFSNTQYCSLCFEVISEEESSRYEPEDEIIFESNVSVKFYNILITVLGAQVLDSFSPKLCCQKCTKTLIQSYKFIWKCTNNIKKLSHISDCILDNSVTDGNMCYKSLFLGLDNDNHSLNILYDKQQYYQNMDLLKRFRELQSKEQNIHNSRTNTLSHELDDITESRLIKKVKKKRKQQSIQFLDILDRNENQDNNIKCKYCVKVYPSLLRLKQHYSRVHAPKDFKCTKCPRRFGSHFLLSQHSKDSHCTVVCSQCGKMYNNMYSLRHHEKTHKLCLICETCGKEYKGKRSFNNHIEQKLCHKLRKSNAEAKFCCDYCKKKYSHKIALSVHIRLEHENGTAYICDWCGKKLSSTSRLKDHVLKHTKQKNFNCDICGGKFVTKASLLYHTRIHTGEKPYKCEFCDMAFLSASRRCEHVKRHHSRPDLECDVCHRKFKGRTDLMRHRKRHFNVSSRLYYNPLNE